MVTQLLARKLVKIPKEGIPNLVRCWGNRGASFLLKCIGAWKNSTSKKHNALEVRYEALADVRRLTTEDGMANKLWHTISGALKGMGWPVDSGWPFRQKLSYKGIVGIVFLWLRTEHHFSTSWLLSRGKKRKERLPEDFGSYLVLTCLTFLYFPLAALRVLRPRWKLSCGQQILLVQQTGQHSTVKLWNLQTWDYSCQFNLFHCKNWSILRVNKMNNLSSTVRTSIDTCLAPPHLLGDGILQRLTEKGKAPEQHSILRCIDFETNIEDRKTPKSHHPKWLSSKQNMENMDGLTS